ncbi:MAG: AMP-binding protein, partial [candidate division Zixibacteria bacterium]|nr:AMP-binding protein [candidate division Zixibacteria bacterium]
MMSNIGSYEQRLKNFDWSVSKQELGYKKGDPINIGWYCSDRICKMGKGSKMALIWEDFKGNNKYYTYDDIRTYSNTFADYFLKLGLKPGERICIFMDRVPELYISFLGILKMGGIAQPLFSAFGEESLLTRLENAKTSAILTQLKHVSKVRRILKQIPHQLHIIVFDAGTTALKERE